MQNNIFAFCFFISALEKPHKISTFVDLWLVLFVQAAGLKSHKISKTMLVYWHKKDLRIFDNDALMLSLKLCRENNLKFLPIIGLEKDLIENTQTSYEFSDFYIHGFISASLPLIFNYKHFGIQAGLFYDSVIAYLNNINNLNQITHLVSHQEHGTNGTFFRDKLVKQFCKKHNIIWHQIAPSGVVRNLDSRDNRDKYVKVYLNSRVVPIPSFEGINQPNCIDNTDLMSQFKSMQGVIASKYNLQATSEKSSHTCLQSFTNKRAANYRGGISSPNKAIISGSRLSQYLAFGSISLRYVIQYFWKSIKLAEDKKIRAGILGAIQWLYWREHFIQRLETSPDMPDVAIHPEYNKIQYNNQFFIQYQAGNTGEPLIDACIRCLKATGFINFRMRAMLVSYGVFGLDLNWRHLGRFSATIFLDYEPGIHWSQIQMQAGVTGINTIRVYSPHKQLLDQDSECIFVKEWIPEIRHLTVKQIQSYTKNSLNNLTDGLYPDPIIDFKIASKLNKAKNYSLKSASTKKVSQKVFIKHGSRKTKPKVKLKKAEASKVDVQTETLF